METNHQSWRCHNHGNRKHNGVWLFFTNRWSLRYPKNVRYYRTGRRIMMFTTTYYCAPSWDRLLQNTTPNFISARSTLTHLCLTFHYWNGSDVVVVYFLLRKVFAESDFSPMSASRQGTCYLVVHRVSHCCRYWRAGSWSKSDENFSEDFFTTIQRQVKYSFTALHPILVFFFSTTSLLVMLLCSKKKIPKLLLLY